MLTLSYTEGVWRRDERDERDREGPRDEGISWRRTGDRDGPPRRGKETILE